MVSPPKKKNDDTLLGQDIRALRKSRGLSLTDMATKAGCSVGYISEVERGGRTVSIKHLRGISEALGVQLGWFFTHENLPENERGKIVRAKHRRQLGSALDGLFEELVSPNLSGTFETFLTQIDPKAKSNGLIDRGVEEEGYIIQGELTLTLDKESFALKEGDSFHINKNSFSWVNTGNLKTIILWVTSPPVY